MIYLPGTYQQGFAPRDFEPRFPELWRGCVYASAPCLGPTGGVLREWSGYKNDGTITNATLDNAWARSVGLSALQLDGVDDFVSVPHISAFASLSTGSVFSLWFYPTVSGAFQNLISKPSFNAFELRISSGDKLQFNASSGSQITSSTSVWLNNWNHAALVFNSSSTRMFLNRTLEATGAFTLGDNTSAINFGRRLQFTDFYFTGMLDDFRIYNQQLPDTLLRLLSLRRGIAYEPRPSVYTETAEQFLAAWLSRQSTIIGGGIA